jgi:hypothetical protein
MAVFQAQALEVHEKLESAQQNLFTKVEVVQNYYRVVDHSLNNIYIKGERGHCSSSYFPGGSFHQQKDEVAKVSRLSLSEQTRGDIILKPGRLIIVESKRLAKEVKKACEEAFLHSTKSHWTLKEIVSLRPWGKLI